MAIDITALLAVKTFPIWVYWFAGAIQALGIAVSFYISYLGYVAYKLTNEKKYKYFFYGFLFLGLNFLSNLALNVLLRLGYAKYIVEQKYTLFVAPLFLLYYFFWLGLMLAYVSLAIVYSDVKKTNLLWLFYFWTFLIGVYVFRDKFMFNMFSAVLISFIVLQTYEKYKKLKHKNMLLTFIAFLCLFIFHVMVLFEETIRVLFVFKYVVLLVGLGLLLITLLKIHGRKKK